MTAGDLGRVTLVGAGPGDPELLTVKAIRAMQDADIILFDALVSEEILAYARKETKRMLVGKRGHRPSCRQDDINDLMLKLARQGKHVVRLKGGDSVLFGRAGEEIAHLKAAGIPVSVIPGITSASAMAASLGVSLTHRDHSQSVRFVTGHSRQGTLPEGLDWKGLAASDTTLVIYMGAKTGAAFAQRLIDEGLSPSTPCIAAAAVSRPNQAYRPGTIADLASETFLDAMEGPVLIGIGTAFAQVAHADYPASATPHIQAEMMKNHAKNRIFDRCAIAATAPDDHQEFPSFSLYGR